MKDYKTEGCYAVPMIEVADGKHKNVCATCCEEPNKFIGNRKWPRGVPLHCELCGKSIEESFGTPRSN